MGLVVSPALCSNPLTNFFSLINKRALCFWFAEGWYAVSFSSLLIARIVSVCVCTALWARGLSILLLAHHIHKNIEISHWCLLFFIFLHAQFKFPVFPVCLFLTCWTFIRMKKSLYCYNCYTYSCFFSSIPWYKSEGADPDFLHGTCWQYGLELCRHRITATWSFTYQKQ